MDAEYTEITDVNYVICPGDCYTAASSGDKKYSLPSGKYKIQYYLKEYPTYGLRFWTKKPKKRFPDAPDYPFGY